MLFLLKDTSSIEDEKLFKACRSVYLFPRANLQEMYPHRKCKNFNTLSVFSLTIAGISLILHMYTRSQVDSLVYVSDLDLS